MCVLSGTRRKELRPGLVCRGAKVSINWVVGSLRSGICDSTVLVPGADETGAERPNVKRAARQPSFRDLALQKPGGCASRGPVTRLLAVGST